LEVTSNRLSNLGCVIVSGAAMGIDACAHEGANENTIAVFGNSLDKIYPAVNKSLIEKIYKNSLALSEYEKDTMPTNYSFVLRNRLVVAMSEAVIISEADEKSGSMRSAEIALQLGRPIYVLPHRFGESSGTMRLAKDGLAKVIYDTDEFVASLGLATLMPGQSISDKLLEFCKKSPSFDEAFALFGDKLYEYELDGKIEIKNNKVSTTYASIK
jgi:DNA processing protein